MCRIFAFRSIISSSVHRSLVEADNAMLHQSQIHGDGWGVAYYAAHAPHVVKSTSAAMNDALFRRVSGIVASETVVTHIRKATQGAECITNTHPFQYGRWIFVHNGNIREFPKYRRQLLALVAPYLKRFILGNTDSEVLFYVLLTFLARRVELKQATCRIEDLAMATQAALKRVTAVIGPFCQDDTGPNSETFLTFVLTNGSTMLAHHGGKDLFFSTYKTRCAERHTCAHYSACCENPSPTGYVNHLAFSSEPIQGENVWLKMAAGQMIGVDGAMHVHTLSETHRDQQTDKPISV